MGIIEYIFIINKKQSDSHLDRLKGVERSHGFGKFMYKVNKRDLSTKLEMGDFLIYICTKAYSFVVLVGTRNLLT